MRNLKSDLNKREYIALPLDYCYFDRTRYEKLHQELPTEIVSFRKFDTGVIRVLFETKTLDKDKVDIRIHLLWIQLIAINKKEYVKYCCDCKYFDYRQLRPAKRLFELQLLNNDLLIIVDPKTFSVNRELFNLDKHAFLALKELFKIQIPISI